MIQVCGERVLSENRMKRKSLSDQKRQEVKYVKRVEKKRVSKLERTPKYAEYGERNAKENKKDK